MSKWSIVVTSPGQLDVEKFLGEDDKLTIVPNFFGAGDHANSAIIKVMDASGKTLSTSLMVVSGRTGKVTVRDISRPVAPAAERRSLKKKEKDAPTAN